VHKDSNGKEDDTKLIDDFLKEQSDNAFSEIYKKYNKMIYNFVNEYLYYSQSGVVEEIVDDVFVKVYLKLHTLNDKSKFKSWIYQITRNLCKNYIRYQKTQKSASKITDDIVDKKSDLESNLNKKQVKEFIYDEILKSNDKDRELIILKFYEGLTYNDISEITNINVANLKYYMKTALKKLLDKLEEKGYL